MTAEAISVAAIVLGALYSLFGASAILLKGSSAIWNWLKSGNKRRPRRTSEYIIFPSPAELAKYGKASEVEKVQKPSIYGIQRTLDIVNERIDYIKFAVFLVYLLFAVRLLWLKIA